MRYCWIFLLVSQCAIGQSIERLSSAIDSLAQDSDWIYPALEYAPYRRLRQQATNQQLEVLLNHPTASVRVYAFLILLGRGYPKMESILKQHLEDTTYVYDYTQGDVIYDSFTVAEYMLGKIRKQQYPLTQMSYEDYQKKLDTLHGNIIKIELPEIEVDPKELEEDSL